MRVIVVNTEVRAKQLIVDGLYDLIVVKVESDLLTRLYIPEGVHTRNLKRLPNSFSRQLYFIPKRYEVCSVFGSLNSLIEKVTEIAGGKHMITINGLENA